jgi:hypothetical protein
MHQQFLETVRREGGAVMELSEGHHAVWSRQFEIYRATNIVVGHSYSCKVANVISRWGTFSVDQQYVMCFLVTLVKSTQNPPEQSYP